MSAGVYEGIDIRNTHTYLQGGSLHPRVEVEELRALQTHVAHHVHTTASTGTGSGTSSSGERAVACQLS